RMHSGTYVGNNQRFVALLVLRHAQTTHELLDVAARALDRRPDFLLPHGMDVVGHEVALLDGRVAGQAGRWVLRIQHRNRALPGLTRGKLDAFFLHVHIVASMRHEETVTGHADG